MFETIDHISTVPEGGEGDVLDWQQRVWAKYQSARKEAQEARTLLEQTRADARLKRDMANQEALDTYNSMLREADAYYQQAIAENDALYRQTIAGPEGDWRYKVSRQEQQFKEYNDGLAERMGVKR